MTPWFLGIIWRKWCEHNCGGGLHWKLLQRKRFECKLCDLYYMVKWFGSFSSSLEGAGSNHLHAAGLPLSVVSCLPRVIWNLLVTSVIFDVIGYWVLGFMVTWSGGGEERWVEG